MSETIGVLIYRPADVPDRALSEGFAVALAGWDLPNAHLQIARLDGLPNHAAAFYVSGAPREEAAEHIIEIFEDELSPPVVVVEIAVELGHVAPFVHALVHSEEFLHDDGWCFEPHGFSRYFVCDGEDGIEARVETDDPDDDENDVRVLDIDVPDGATEAEERALIDAALAPHRGTTFLSRSLGRPILPAVMRALFDVERKLPIRLVDPQPDSIRRETNKLCRVLRREPGRGAFSPPPTASGATAPPEVAAFIAAYDWHDPKDPEDLYRELSIGAVTGTLRFAREADIVAFRGDPAWQSAGKSLYPVAKLLPSALGAARSHATLALGDDHNTLFLLAPNKPALVAGPTLGELLRYLALGWKERTPLEEDVIGALMLKARLRVEAATTR